VAQQQVFGVAGAYSTPKRHQTEPQQSLVAAWLQWPLHSKGSGAVPFCTHYPTAAAAVSMQAAFSRDLHWSVVVQLAGHVAVVNTVIVGEVQLLHAGVADTFAGSAFLPC
jgi:hypothetical protein